MEYKLIQYLTFLDIVAMVIMVIMRTVELVIVVTVALKGKKVTASIQQPSDYSQCESQKNTNTALKETISPVARGQIQLKIGCRPEWKR